MIDSSRDGSKSRQAARTAWSWIDTHSDDIIDFLRSLIATPSVTGHEQDAQELVARKFREMQLEVDEWVPDIEQLKNHPSFVPVDYPDYGDRKNVVGTLRGLNRTTSMLFNGHADVVPPGDEAIWDYPPWSGAMADGRIYGRGASDMKGGLAAMIYAVQAIRECGIELQGDIVLESVIDEEAGGNGTLAACLRGYRGDVVVIPEPTDLTVAPAHRGAQFYRVKVSGKGTHAGLRFEGTSAIEKMKIVMEAIEALEEVRSRMARENPLYSRYAIACPINVGKIQGGNWPAMVPEDCEIEGMIDIMPGEKIDTVRKQFIDSLLSFAGRDEWLGKHPPKIEWHSVSIRGYSAAHLDCFVDQLSTLCREVTGRETEPCGFPAGSDLRLFKEVLGLEGVHIGPGDIRRAHGFNEYVRVDELIQCTKILSALAIDQCGIGRKT